MGRVEMSRRKLVQHLAIALVVVAPTGLASAQEVASREGLSEPVYRVPKHDPHVKPVQGIAEPDNQQAGEHPLMPAIRMAKKGLAEIDAKYHDYSCTLVKRENIDGELQDYEYMFVKVRHKPFSVYMYFIGPEPIKGRECIYVAGSNDNKLIAHEGGNRIFLPTVKIDPKGFLAMRGQRYPITEVGMRNLTSRLIEVAEQDAKFGECDVKYFNGSKINGRTCTCLQVTHPVRRKNFRFHVARIFIDDEYQIPVRFESYDWPTQAGGQPVLLEEYTYMNVKFNNGFADADFDQRNPKYRFK